MKVKDKRAYQSKIKTPEELIQVIGNRPRMRKVIMCHGTFDIVHPGHIRHLNYASEHGDILVVSLTSDTHINKANFRPYIPEELRAMNLASLEIVDYVIIDKNPTPLENIAKIQPDYFAKGYEYNADGLNPKTKQEIDVIESYGGEMIFTPGDVVFSSSHIIEEEAPNLSKEKLEILMQSENITFDSLRTAIDKLKGVKIHVIGDTIVDSYTYCTVVGSGSKTPTMSLKYEYQHDYTGGAAIVAKHLASAGAKVTFSTILGEDQFSKMVLEDLEKSGVKTLPIMDKSRPTTNKNFFIAQNYRMIKVDKVDNRPIGEKILTKLSKQISENADQDIVMFSDFRHGIFSKSTIPTLINSIPKNVMKVADSQVASRWGNILDFKGFDLITPNEKEARFALGDQDSVIRPLATNLYRKAECKILILKMGEKGLITHRSGDLDDPRKFFTVDSFAKNVVDAVGSGDALLSYASLALSVTKNEAIASILGAIAAALACEKDGNMPISPKEVVERINKIEKEMKYEA